MDVDTKALLARISKRLHATGLSERGAAEAANLSSATIRNIREGKSKSPRLDTITQLAKVLQTTPAWLAYGIGDGAVKPELTPANDAFSFARVDGRVQAGSWVEVDVYDGDDGQVISAPRDPLFPFARQIAYLVGGDSMNKAEPKPIRDGDYVICANFEDAGIEPVNGMQVVIERTRHDGELRERSVKEVMIFPDRTEFHPRSDNPVHKPIVVPKDADPDETTKVEILSLVRFIFDNVPMPVPGMKKG